MCSFTTWNSAAISHKIHAKSGIVKRANRTFTFHADVSDLSEVYVLKMTHLVKQVSSDAAISTSVTPHDLMLISPTIIYRPADIALRITFIPCYGCTVPDYNWCNVDDTISWTTVKREDLIVVVFAPTCSKIIVACKCTRIVCVCLTCGVRRRTSCVNELSNFLTHPSLS